MMKKNETRYRPTNIDEIPNHLKDFAPAELDRIIHRVGQACEELEVEGVPLNKIHVFMEKLLDAEIACERANRHLDVCRRKTVHWTLSWEWPNADIFMPMFLHLTADEEQKLGYIP